VKYEVPVLCIDLGTNTDILYKGCGNIVDV